MRLKACRRRSVIKRKNAQLKMERQVSDEEIKKAVEHAGYKVVA